MQRRNFLVGVGSTAIGASALVGSGAFTSVEADRAATVKTAADSKAYLRLEATADSPNGDYAYEDDAGRLKLDLSSSNDSLSGDGVNPDAVTNVDDVFVIQNQGTQAVDVWIAGAGSNVAFEDSSGNSLEDSSNPVNLGVGDLVTVSLSIDSTDVAKGTELIDGGEVTVHAQA